MLVLYSEFQPCKCGKLEFDPNKSCKPCGHTGTPQIYLSPCIWHTVWRLLVVAKALWGVQVLWTSLPHPLLGRYFGLPLQINSLKKVTWGSRIPTFISRKYFYCFRSIATKPTPLNNDLILDFHSRDETAILVYNTKATCRSSFA